MTHSTLQLGLALAGALAGFGLTILLLGTGLVWVARAKLQQQIVVPLETREPVTVGGTH